MVLRGELDLAGGFEGALRLLRLAHLNLAVFVVGGFVAPVETDSRFQDQKHVVSGALDFADRLRDPVGFGQGIVDGIPQLLHEVLQWLVHRELLNIADAPETTGVPATRPSIHPNSIVVDTQPVHKLEPFTLSTVYQPDITVRWQARTALLPLGSAEAVRLAARRGFFATCGAGRRETDSCPVEPSNWLFFSIVWGDFRFPHGALRVLTRHHALWCGRDSHRHHGVVWNRLLSQGPQDFALLNR